MNVMAEEQNYECQGCCEIERIATIDTKVTYHGELLSSLDTKVDALIEKIGDMRGQQASNSFIGGVASAGAMFGIGIYKLLSPIVKPVLGLLFPSIGALMK